MSEHGTYAHYVSGCRCQLCGLANADYHREYMRELRRLARIGKAVESLIEAEKEKQ